VITWPVKLYVRFYVFLTFFKSKNMTFYVFSSYLTRSFLEQWSDVLRDADEAKKGRLRRRSGDGTDLGTSLYSYPAGTLPSTLAQYKVLHTACVDQLALPLYISYLPIFRHILILLTLDFNYILLA